MVMILEGCNDVILQQLVLFVAWRMYVIQASNIYPFFDTHDYARKKRKKRYPHVYRYI